MVALGLPIQHVLQAAPYSPKPQTPPPITSMPLFVNIVLDFTLTVRHQMFIWYTILVNINVEIYFSNALIYVPRCFMRFVLF